VKSEVLLTKKVAPLLATPLTVTTTAPEVAAVGTWTVIEVSPHVDGVAAIPLKVTVPVLALAPKLLPLIVTVAPTPPRSGFSELMTGAGTVKLAALL
jgi:hypothetical protein